MKRYAVMILAAAWMLAALCAAAETAMVRTPTDDGTVYIRSVAGAGQPILGVARNGDTLTVLSRGNTWHRVRVERTGVAGYMYGVYIQFLESATPERAETAPDGDGLVNLDAYISSSDGYANLRWGPGLNYGAFSRLYNGECVWALERAGDWYRCASEAGQIGYIHKNILRLSDTSSGAYGKTGMIQSSDGFANVRAGAGMGQSVLYTLYSGQTIGVYGASGSWYNIGTTERWGGGYVYRTLVRFLSSATVTGEVNLRSAPNWGDNVRRILHSGARVTLLSTDGSFCRVDAGGYSGYVSKEYIKY